MKVTQIDNKSTVKAKRAYLQTDGNVYELVIDFENRNFEYDVNSSDKIISLFFNSNRQENTAEFSLIEFDLSENITDDKYDFICNVHTIKEKEQLIIRIYATDDEEFNIIDSFEF